MRIKELESVSILGLGLLGGSVGLAVNRSFPGIYRIGYSHRQVTRDKALQAGVVDVVYPSVAQAVAKARLVILASPISVFADLMRQMIGPLELFIVLIIFGIVCGIPIVLAIVFYRLMQRNKDENTRLRREIEKLVVELEQLRKQKGGGGSD